MADLDKLSFKGTYDIAFADNTSNDITAGDMRDFSVDIADSFTQTKYASPSVAGSTITFDFGDRQRGVFALSTFSTPKTIAYSNASTAKEQHIVFIISDVAATLTFPSGTLMSDVRWASLTWTAAEVGKYKATAVYNGTNWYLEISQSVFV